MIPDEWDSLSSVSKVDTTRRTRPHVAQGYVSPVFLVEPGVARVKWPIIAYTRPDVGAAMCDTVLHTQTDALFGPAE